MRAAQRSAATFALLVALPLTACLASAPADAAARHRHEAQASRSAATPSRAQRRHHAVRRDAANPRMRDAPQELLPANAAAGALPASPRAACLEATRRAEQVHDIPRGLLVAIALSESGLHAHALNIGGRAYFPEDRETARRLLSSGRGTLMAGCVQVNARVHARNSDWPLDPMRSADWAGGMLRRWYNELGSWDDALRRWHGGSPTSARRVVCRVRAKLEVTAPELHLFDANSCGETEMARVRRNGQALLEVAQAEDR